MTRHGHVPTDLGAETSRGMARRAPNPTELFYEVFWIIKFSFLKSKGTSIITIEVPFDLVKPVASK